MDIRMGLFKLRVMVKVTQNRISFGCIFERRRGAGVPTHDTRVKTGIIQRIVTRDPKTLKTVSWSRRCPPCRTPDGITSVIQRCLGSSTNHTHTHHTLCPLPGWASGLEAKSTHKPVSKLSDWQAAFSRQAVMHSDNFKVPVLVSMMCWGEENTNPVTSSKVTSSGLQSLAKETDGDIARSTIAAMSDMTCEGGKLEPRRRDGCDRGRGRGRTERRARGRGGRAGGSWRWSASAGLALDAITPLPTANRRRPPAALVSALPGQVAPAAMHRWHPPTGRDMDTYIYF